MGKTNFTKVEKSLDDGLIKMTSQHLLEETNQATNKKPNPGALPTQEVCRAVLQNVDRALKKLHKLDDSVYKKVGFHRQNLKKLLANPSLLTPQDWVKIKEVRERIETYKKELSSQLPYLSDDDLVEQERNKHVNKRFNVNDKWLPLK